MGLTKMPKHRVCIAENVAIEKATEDFRKLLNEELQRIKEISQGNGSEKIDFSTLDKLIIGVITGDGIGPIITREAVKVLDSALSKEISSGSVEIRQIDGQIGRAHV